MYLIKPCPTCGRIIRFPIDRGKLKVKCPCGAAFIADPDDTAIYKNSRIDPGFTKKLSFFDSLIKLTGSIRTAEIKIKVINLFFESRYRLQNLPLLPIRERIVIILQLTAILILTISLILFLISLLQP